MKAAERRNAGQVETGKRLHRDGLARVLQFVVSLQRGPAAQKAQMLSCDQAFPVFKAGDKRDRLVRFGQFL